MPYTQWYNLRTLFIRAHHVPPHSGDEGSGNVKEIDVDEMFGLGDAK